MNESRSGERLVVLGRVSGAFGVQGWVNVRSYTEPAEALLSYGPLLIATAAGWQRRAIESGRATHRGVQVKLAGIDNRNDAALLRGAELAVMRSALPAPAAGQYYLSDLEGLEVVSPEGQVLGRVEHFLETPAHPVMVIRGDKEHLVPMVADRVLDVDLGRGRITVDWQPDW